ncbi:MAG: FAD-dependent oxidoreductase, partial [Legionellales bacterium]
LVGRGFSNITVLADQFDNLTSHNAGGLFSPSFKVPDPQLIEDLGIESYIFYACIAKKEHPHLTGARIISAYFPTREDSDLEPFVGKVMAPGHEVILDFGNGTQKPMIAYDDGIFIDVGCLMREMRAFLNASNVKFEQRHISSFNEITANIIVNCTGLGAQDLMDGERLMPVQGHLIMLKHQNPEELNYMICASLGQDTTADGFKMSRYFYFIPKTIPNAVPHEVGVIGGTFIKGAGHQTPHDEEFEQVIAQAKAFFGIND